MKMHDFVCDKAIIADLKATDRNAAIAELVDSLVAAGAAPESLREELAKLIIQREKHGSTGFGKGVAIPHVMSDKIKKMVAAIGVSQKGVDFNALDKAPVFTIFLLLSP
ncbi:MAG: PTS sugar transporter subunit IIA, partial [Planctomycetota bacterium]|nr:PTS sugar transporter subunit IIA [Planctomycetota bacterium]